MLHRHQETSGPSQQVVEKNSAFYLWTQDAVADWEDDTQRVTICFILFFGILLQSGHSQVQSITAVRTILFYY